MKHGKYYIGGLVLLGLIAGGTGLITNHSDSNKSAQSHKSVKTSSSTSQKQPKKRVDKEKKTSSSSKVDISSSSVVSSSQPEISSSSTNNDTRVSDSNNTLPVPQTKVAAFIQQYGVTPAGWLVENKGMSIKDALYATPNDQETSGELQTEWSYRQGTHDQMFSSYDSDTDSSDEVDDDWTQDSDEGYQDDNINQDDDTYDIDITETADDE